MKLFIINKPEFEETFDCLDSKSFSSKLIHSDAYSQLMKSIEINHSIPLILTPSYDENGIALFNFLSKKGDIYFYQFTGTDK